MLLDWYGRGFAQPPEFKVAGPQGLIVYRAWGGSSSEWGSGYFSLEKPESVLDAELRFNIADWGNQIHFVSTFRLRPGHACYVGPVRHGAPDLRRPGTQVFLPSPFVGAIERIGEFESLRHDAFVSPRPGHA